MRRSLALPAHSKTLPCIGQLGRSRKRSSMGRELRIVGFVVLAAIAFSLLDTYNKQSAKPMPMPLPIADETKPEPPRTVRVIQIYKTPSDQVPDEPTPEPVV